MQDRRQDLQAMGATLEGFRHRAKLAEQQRDELVAIVRRYVAVDDIHDSGLYRDAHSALMRIAGSVN